MCAAVRADGPLAAQLLLLLLRAVRVNKQLTWPAGQFLLRFVTEKALPSVKEAAEEAALSDQFSHIVSACAEVTKLQLLVGAQRSARRRATIAN